MLLATVGACRSAPLIRDEVALLPAWRAAVASDVQVVVQPFEALPEQLEGLGGAALLVVDESWREPAPSVPQPVLAALRAHLDAGGRLVLFGHAARLAHELGLETERPECDVYRWGYDRRALQGDAELLLQVTSGELPELFDGLESSVEANAFAVSGGVDGVTLPYCSWRIGPVRDGRVLARCGVVEDGEPQPLGGAVMVHWRVGAGAVLACGVVPTLLHEQARVRDNAQRLVQACAAWACAGVTPRLAMLVPEERRPRLPATPFTDGGGPPIRSALGHWGWHVSLYDGDDIEDVRPVEELLRDALLPSWQSGADLVEFGLSDAQHGAPLVWSERDPIQPPVSFRGQPRDGPWTHGELQQLAEQAHVRGMLALGALDPLPVGDRPTERLVTLRMHARELASVRRHGAGALDGFGVRQWWQDTSGYGVAMVQDYQPAAVLYAAGERTPVLGGGLRAQDADDGALPGLNFAGVSAGWRGDFAPDRFPVAVLDGRAASDSAPGVGVRGGGTTPDWLVRQFQDFVRSRRGRGGAVLWRRHDPRTLGSHTAAYVNGLGIEPLTAAVAMPLAATGQGGIRAAVRELLPDAPASFAATVDANAVVHALQNNWFQLLGSGGALRIDPLGLADFDGPQALQITASLLHTRLSGGRPSGESLTNESVDLLANGRRGAGDYESTARIGGYQGAEVRVPSLLGRDTAPDWPSAVEFVWTPSQGLHELRLTMRPTAGAGLVAVSLDDVLLRCFAVPASGEVVPWLLPVHVAHGVAGGERVLRIAVLEGRGLALDEVRLERIGDVAVEAEAVVPAGSVAQVLERSWSSYHEERTTITALADMPGFVFNAQCVRSVRGLQVERRLSLPGYATVIAASGEAAGAVRRTPFVLRHPDAHMPDLLLVPLQLSRYEKLQVEAGGVRWRSTPEAGMSARLGVLFWPHGEADAVLPHAQRLLDAIDRPLSIELGPDHKVSIATDTPIGHSRLLHVEDRARGPYLVRERGFWSWRAGQPALGGGNWVRVHQEPDDVVELVAGPAVLARTRPGPGSLRLLALEEPGPTGCVAHLLQPSLLGAPSVVMALEFDEVQLDGRPWAFHDGRRVMLPRQPGSYRVETALRGRGAASTPHVRATAAPLRECYFDVRRRELVLDVPPDRSRPDGLPWTAVLAGPRPSTVDNGEIVDVSELHLADAVAEAVAGRGGVLIRFRPGRTVIRYTTWNERPGR